jgi:hypothetical protein
VFRNHSLVEVVGHLPLRTSATWPALAIEVARYQCDWCTAKIGVAVAPNLATKSSKTKPSLVAGGLTVVDSVTKKPLGHFGGQQLWLISSGEPATVSELRIISHSHNTPAKGKAAIRLIEDHESDADHLVFAASQAGTYSFSVGIDSALSTQPATWDMLPHLHHFSVILKVTTTLKTANRDQEPHFRAPKRQKVPNDSPLAAPVSSMFSAAGYKPSLPNTPTILFHNFVPENGETVVSCVVRSFSAANRSFS